MSFFNNLKIGRRLGIGFGSQMLLMAIILVIGIYNISLIKATMVELVTVVNRKAELTDTIVTAVDNIFLDMAEMLSLPDKNKLPEYKRGIEEWRAKYRKDMEELEKLEVNDEGKRLIAAFKSKIGEAREGNIRVIELAMAGKQVEAAALYHGTVKIAHDEMSKIGDELMAYQQKRTHVRFDEIMGYIVTTKTELIIAGLVALILSIALGLSTTFSITRPVAQGVAFADRMAGGDLTQTLEIHQEDEIGNLAAALNRMGVSLRNMFREMTDGVQTLSSSATELAAISRQMTTSAEQSSARAHSVATAAEEMLSLIHI